MEHDVTRLLRDLEKGDAQAAERLLPLVYAELRRLARQRMKAEPKDHLLQPTALVHEAYLRLVDGAQDRQWSDRSHFFATAAEAMRRILIDEARRKRSVKRGGGRGQESLDAEVAVTEPQSQLDVIALDEALQKLAAKEPQHAKLVELRYFGGLTLEEAARVLGLSPRAAKSQWTYARAWLRREIEGASREQE